MLHTRSKEMIVIAPKDIDEMGRIAHLLGNTHKPVKVGKRENHFGSRSGCRKNSRPQ